MSEHEVEIKKTVQPWIVSLGISVLCCALFFAIMSNYVTKLNEALDKIDNRLALMEARASALASAPAPSPSPAPLTVGTTPAMPPVQLPTVDAPGVQSGAVSGSSGSGQPTPVTAPVTVQVPEAVAPVLPSVPTKAAPIVDPTGGEEPNQE